MTYEEIDALRLKAFKTNSETDRSEYFLAASKWFQDEVYRRMERAAELATLRADVCASHKALRLIEMYMEDGAPHSALRVAKEALK